MRITLLAASQTSTSGSSFGASPWTSREGGTYPASTHRGSITGKHAVESPPPHASIYAPLARLACQFPLSRALPSTLGAAHPDDRADGGHDHRGRHDVEGERDKPGLHVARAYNGKEPQERGDGRVHDH